MNRVETTYATHSWLRLAVARIALTAPALLATVPLAAQNPFAAQIQQASAATALLSDGDLHVILCGTSGPLFAPDRAGPCTAVIAGERFFLVDAGSRAGDSLALFGLPVDRLSGVLLTHFHSDHIADLGEINFGHWTRGSGSDPLLVYGPTGIESVVAGFTAAYDLDRGYRVAHHGEQVMPPAGSRASARVIEFPAGKTSTTFYRESGLEITAFLVDHPPIVPSVGYRFDWAGRSVVVSGDTMRSDNLIAAARGADLLVHEVIADGVIAMAAPALESAGNPRGAQILRDALTNHTFPADVFRVAAEAGVKALVLSHLVPPLPPAQAPAAFTRGKEAFSGEIVVGEDGMHFVLPKNSGPLRKERLGGRTP